jgi:hypothetical protein
MRVPGFLGSQTARQSAHEGGKVVSPTHWPPFPPGNIPGIHFLEGHSAAGENNSMKNSRDTNENRTRDLPACSTVPQPKGPLRATKEL